MEGYNYHHQMALRQAALEAHLARLRQEEALQPPRILMQHPLMRRAQVLDQPLTSEPATLPQGLGVKKHHQP